MIFRSRNHFVLRLDGLDAFFPSLLGVSIESWLVVLEPIPFKPHRFVVFNGICFNLFFFEGWISCEISSIELEFYFRCCFLSTCSLKGFFVWADTLWDSSRWFWDFEVTSRWFLRFYFYLIQFKASPSFVPGRTLVDPFQLSKRQIIIQACKTTASYDVYCRLSTSQTRCKTPDPRQTKRAWEREVSIWRQQIREFSP